MLSVALYIKDNPLIRETFCVVIFNKDIVSPCSLTHSDITIIAKDWGQYFVYKAIKNWIQWKKLNCNKDKKRQYFFEKKTQTGNVEFVRCEVLATLRVVKVWYLPSPMLLWFTYSTFKHICDKYSFPKLKEILHLKWKRVAHNQT